MPNVIHERLLPKFNFWFKQFSMEFCFGNFLFIKEFCTFFWRKEWDFNCLLIDFFLFQFWWKSGFWFWMYGFLLKFLKLRHYCNAFGSVDLCMVENLFFWIENEEYSDFGERRAWFKPLNFWTNLYQDITM